MNLPTSQKISPRKGFFITTVSVIVLLGLVMLSIAYKQGKFDRNLTLHFVTTSGNHLSKGMPVVFEGFKIGQLTRVELQADASVTGEVLIQEKHQGLVTQGSSLRLSKEKIVTSELHLQSNRNSKNLLQDGQAIELVRHDLTVDLEKHLMDKLDPAVAQLTAMALQLSDPAKGLPATLQHLNGSLSEANKLLASLNNKMTDPRLDNLMGNLDKTVGNLRTDTEQLGKTLETTNQLLKKSDQTLDDFREGTLGKWLAPRRSSDKK